MEYSHYAMALCVVITEFQKSHIELLIHNTIILSNGYANVICWFFAILFSYWDEIERKTVVLFNFFFSIATIVRKTCFHNLIFSKHCNFAGHKVWVHFLLVDNIKRISCDFFLNWTVRYKRQLLLSENQQDPGENRCISRVAAAHCTDPSLKGVT